MSSQARPSSTPESVGAGRHVGAALLVVVMAAGSIVMWLVSPIAWLWIASRMTDSSQPSLGPYLLVLVGMALTAVIIGKGLGKVNRAHMRLTGRLSDRREARSWNKSMRGERQSASDRGVLEQVMAISVSCALVLFGIWFFAFAGSSLPG
jgi:MFS family permease